MTHIGREREILLKLQTALSNNRAQKDKQQTILGGNCKHRLKESCLTFWQDDNESSSIEEYLAAPQLTMLGPVIIVRELGLVSFECETR